MSFAGCGGNGGPSAETRHQLQASLAKYEAYLQENAEKLTHWAGTIVLKVKEGSAGKAQSRFAAAQVPRGHIDPAAQQSDGSIDEGFLHLEKTFFEEERTAGTLSEAKQLRADIEALQRQLEETKVGPAQIAAGARQVLDDVADSDLTGEAQPYAEGELSVVAAKIEGVGAAIAAVKPLLREEDPELLTEVEASFDKALAEIGQYGILASAPEQTRPQEPGIAFIVFDGIGQGEINELIQAIETLAEQLVQAESKLDG